MNLVIRRACYRFNLQFCVPDLIDSCHGELMAKTLLECQFRRKILDIGRNANQTYSIADSHLCGKFVWQIRCCQGQEKRMMRETEVQIGNPGQIRTENTHVDANLPETRISGGRSLCDALRSHIHPASRAAGHHP